MACWKTHLLTLIDDYPSYELFLEILSIAMFDDQRIIKEFPPFWAGTEPSTQKIPVNRDEAARVRIASRFPL